MGKGKAKPVNPRKKLGNVKLKIKKYKGRRLKELSKNQRTSLIKADFFKKNPLHFIVRAFQLKAGQTGYIEETELTHVCTMRIPFGQYKNRLLLEINDYKYWYWCVKQMFVREDYPKLYQAILQMYPQMTVSIQEENERTVFDNFLDTIEN